MARKYNQAGFAPIVIILILGLIGGSVFVAIRNNVPTQVASSPTPTVSSTPTSSSTPSAKPSVPPAAKPSSTPSPSPTSTASTPTPEVTTIPSQSPSQSPSLSPTPSPSPSPSKKTYTWSGTNVNATVSCYIGETTFDVSISGDVPSPTGDNGIWTTLTGDGKTTIISYQGQASTPHIAMSYDDQVGAIRSGGPTTLKASNTTTYGYELNVYYAPYTDGMPSLSNSIGNVSFAIDS